MKLHYTEFWNWEKKILYDVEMLDYYKIEFTNINKNNDYHFYFLERNQFIKLFKHDILNRVSFKELDKTYKKSELLKEYYKELLNFCKENEIKKIIFTSTGQYWHPEFLKQLKSIWIDIYLFTADDDSNTINYCSRPYTQYYDIHFHVWVMYDKQGTTIADKLKEWWWNPIRIPLGARADHINNNIDFENRNIDICYIGNINPRKLFRLSKLKRHFGNRLKLYGWQGNGDFKSLKWLFYKITNKIFWLWYIEPLSEEKLKEIYRRTKIGFNMHLVDYKWPSNSRMYELPCNGVMEICDNEKWLSHIYKIWKEIVAYNDIKNAIQKIEYYLQNDDKRIEIAKAGYKRARNNYSIEKSFLSIFNLIYQNNKF